MNDDEIKKLWQLESADAPPALPNEQQLAAIKKRTASFGRTIFWRDARESIVAIFLIGYFGWAYFRLASSTSRIGCILLILSCLLICWYPIWRKRRAARIAPDAPMLETLRCELRKVDVQIDLLRSIAWWYLLPLGVGVIIYNLGIAGSLGAWISYAIFVIALFAFIYWQNQRAVRKTLLPLKREIESLLNFDESVPLPEPPKKKFMTKTMLLGIVLLSLGAIVFVRGKNAQTPAIEYSDPVSQMLETIREKHNFPALAAAFVVDGKIVATNAVGFRKFGGDERVEVDDKFHIGSVTKSMTATVAAMLIEQGKISWTTTIGETFPELKNKIHPDYLNVTLEQLLSQRSGAPGNAPSDLWIKAWAAKGTPAEQRMTFVKGLLARKPEAKPGTKYIYSNQGYSIAGVMLEKASGKTWENLLRTMLFEPLGMTTAGFGAPASPGEVDQPWGHTRKVLSGVESVPPGPRADNPLAISPAGAVHCSVGDLAKYAAFHMAGERGESRLLKAESFKKLHTAIGDDYALGWVVLERPWAKGRALMHNGSNTMFYVVVWMAPEINSAVIVATNIGGDGAFQGCDEAASKLIGKYLAK